MFASTLSRSSGWMTCMALSGCEMNSSAGSPRSSSACGLMNVGPTLAGLLMYVTPGRRSTSWR